MNEQIEVVALHREFVLLAKTRVEGTWTCYGMVVSGVIDHETEARELWQARGSKQREEIARAAFPHKPWSEMEYVK